jgi:hypothetical protein
MPLHSGSWWQDILAIIPFLMTGQLKRSTDFWAAWIGKVLSALAVCLATGSLGGYVALSMHDYRLSLLERHEAEDKAEFAKMRDELAAIKERHRIDDLHNNGKVTP